LCNPIREPHRETGQRHVKDVYYGGRRLTREVEFSRGGWKTIFQDGQDGNWRVRIRGGPDERERAFLN